MKIMGGFFPFKKKKMMKHFSSCPASYIHEIKEQDQCQHEITATLVFWGRAEAVEHSDHTGGRLKKTKNNQTTNLATWRTDVFKRDREQKDRENIEQRIVTQQRFIWS